MSMPGHTALFIVAAIFAAFVLLLATRIGRIVWLLWAACLAPLFVFGPGYAKVGFHPIFLMDVLVGLALLATVGVWGPRLFSEERLRGFRSVAVLLAVMMTQAVYRGVSSDYPDPLKGVILGVYPVFAWFAATWWLTRPHEEFPRWRWILYLAPLGPVLHLLFDTPMTAAASGLYLAIAGAFGVHLRHRGDSRLLIWTLVGAAVLTSLVSKRGPLLAVVTTIAATSLASRASRRRTARWPVFSWTLVMVGVVAAVVLSVSGQRLSEAPVVGGFVSRVELSVNDPRSESADNVELRIAMWKGALSKAADNPLFGTGAGHPMDILFEGRPIHDPKTGPHNSYVGYVFYLGWPSAIALIVLIGATLRRTWRARHHLVGATWFGATVAVAITACTNVAFETTFIGLPSWLVLACAFSLVGVPDGERTAKPRDGNLVDHTGPTRRAVVPARRITPTATAACSHS